MGLDTLADWQRLSLVVNTLVYSVRTENPRVGGSIPPLATIINTIYQ